jgi:Bacteriocin-protection, YdeI or OmpD-Associated
MTSARTKSSSRSWGRHPPTGRPDERLVGDGETRTRTGDGEAVPPAQYHWPVSGQKLPGGVVHQLPTDLRKALIANATALDAWKDITPLARNEFICWVEDAKQETTRERRIRRTQEELEEGQRRPCCWPGCKHRDRIGR